MLGRTIGGATVAVIQGIIVLLLSFIVGFRITDIRMLPLALLFMILTALLFTALGTAIASLMDDMHGFQLISNFLIMPIFFLSGALFPFDGLPPVLTTIARLNPLAYGVDGLRGAMNMGFHFGLMTDISVLIVITFVFLAIGSYLFSKIEV